MTWLVRAEKITLQLWRRKSVTVLLMGFLWLYDNDAALQTIYRVLVVVKL